MEGSALFFVCVCVSVKGLGVGLSACFVCKFVHASAAHIFVACVYVSVCEHTARWVSEYKCVPGSGGI